ncbi:hypothetical protein P691DRAFT_160750 [Macrolepiota fuliginosa MF-IS2]|uniref:Uncharacterized protein n=1 Tax=Macrolepiota fuliginosa MF-IS2 TaxID=1400762 RepID=A0A9P5X9W6_9AGAR|nr:hypothetical protein P691DRAFT_160750 [Macrolepiota fuliginosa MF-IS2]
MGIPELQDATFTDRPMFMASYFGSHYRRQLVFVCKKFSKIVLPLYYENLVLSLGSDIISSARYLERNPDVGKRVKSIYLRPSPRWEHKWHIVNGSSHLNTILSVVPNLQRLFYFHGPDFDAGREILDWTALTTLSSTAGSQLCDLELRLSGGVRAGNLEQLTQFSALKSITFQGGGISFDKEGIPKTALPQLESLTCRATDNTFLSILSAMDLPKLIAAHFPRADESVGAATFLRKHGHQILFLEAGFLPAINCFDTCPNLVFFVLPESHNGIPAAEFFFSTNKHHKLKAIYINTTDVASSTNKALKQRFEYLGDLDLSNFPSLRRIRIAYAQWPATEREIEKNNFVEWAEYIKGTFGVDVIDGRDQTWVPRLKSKKRLRK